MAACTVASPARRHRARLSGAAAALLAGTMVPAGAALAQSVPVGPFRDGDYTCTPQKMTIVGRTTSGYANPNGSRVLAYVARCRRNDESPVDRAYLAIIGPDGARRRISPIAVPPGSTPESAAQAVVGLHLLLPDPFVVGTYQSAADGNRPLRAFRYDLDTDTFLDLGVFAGAPTFSQSAAMGGSFDGKVVVGASDKSVGGGNVTRAFRWTRELGLVDLTPNGYLGYDRAGSIAYASNEAGDVVVGQVQAGNSSRYRAFRWQLTDAATGAGTLTELGPDAANALAISGDGAVIGGVTSGNHGFRWTAATGVVDLGTLPGTSMSAVTAMSHDGSILVGISDNDFITFSAPLRGPSFGNNARAFRWTAASGMRDLTQLLAATGVDMTGITLSSALTISADGTLIGGSGIFPGSTEQQAYLIRYVDGATPSGGFETFDPTLTGGGSNGGGGGSGGGGSGSGTGGSGGGTSGGGSTGGITTLAAQQRSVDALARSRLGSAAFRHALAATLLGDNERLRAGDQAGAFVGTGAMGGASGRTALGHGLSVLGGIGYGARGYRSVRVDDAWLIAAKARYLGALSPHRYVVVEAGGFWSPRADYRFDRSYANGAGSASGSGRADGSHHYLFARLGLATEMGRAGEAALTGEVGRQQFHTDAYAENAGPTNPFAAVLTPATDRGTVLKLRAQLSHAVTSRLDATLWAAVARSVDNDTGLTAVIDGVGPVRAAAPGGRWGEYGGRIGYALGARLAAGVFATGSTGAGMGARAQVGGELRLAL